MKKVFFYDFSLRKFVFDLAPISESWRIEIGGKKIWDSFWEDGVLEDYRTDVNSDFFFFFCFICCLFFF